MIAVCSDNHRSKGFQYRSIMPPATRHIPGYFKNQLASARDCGSASCVGDSLCPECPARMTLAQTRRGAFTAQHHCSQAPRTHLPSTDASGQMLWRTCGSISGSRTSLWRAWASATPRVTAGLTRGSNSGYLSWYVSKKLWNNTQASSCRRSVPR